VKALLEKAAAVAMVRAAMVNFMVTIGFFYIDLVWKKVSSRRREFYWRRICVRVCGRTTFVCVLRNPEWKNVMRKM
jgi:hypothetical protein